MTKLKRVAPSSGISVFLIFGLLAINGCSTFDSLRNDHHTGQSNISLQNQRMELDSVQEKIQQIRVALRQGRLTKARRLAEMVLLDVQWLAVAWPTQKPGATISEKLSNYPAKHLTVLIPTALTSEVTNEKKSKKFIA